MNPELIPPVIKNDEHSFNFLRGIYAEDGEDVYLSHAVDYLNKNIGKGTKCPCCERWAKLNAYYISANNALSLMWLASVTTPSGHFVDMPNVAPRKVLKDRQFGRLELFGLAQSKKQEKDDKKRHSGQWRITELGAQFIENKVKIPKKIYTFNKNVIGVSDDLVGVMTAMESCFDYQKIFQEVFKENIKDKNDFDQMVKDFSVSSTATSN